MNIMRKRGASLIGPAQHRENSRRIPDLLVLLPIFVILVGLLALSVGSEGTQAQNVTTVKVAFIGDAGISSNARAVLALIQNEGADFVLHQGDFAYGNQDAAAARAWNDQVNAVLGADYPYFGAVGNHDDSAWPTYQGLFQDRLNRNPDAVCQGDYGVNTACHYKGIFFILSGVGTRGSGHVQFIENQLAQDNSTWSICTWHKTQRAMQVGSKQDETGWGAYEACREGGAIIATAHEHTYLRTKTLTDFEHQVVDPVQPNRDDVRVIPGSTFAFLSALGGKSVRAQERCLPTSYPYGCNGEWANIYTSDQGAKPGALFIEFNFGGDPNKARGRFIDIDGKVIDEFMITAAGSNTAPEGNARQINAAEDTARAVILTGSDADGDTLVFSVLNGPNRGSLSGNAPNLSYTPEANFSGSDSFTFVANDGMTNSAPATMLITVTPVNDAPVAANQSVSVAGGGPRGITLAGSDVDGDGLSFTVLTSPVHGGLSGTPPNVTYTPNVGFTGADSFTFRTNDGALNSNVAAVSVTVAINSNTAPVGSDDSTSTSGDTAVSITVLGNDTDANGDTLQVTNLTQPGSGGVTPSSNNTVTYTPVDGFTGSDSFTYTANDGLLDSNVATVTVSVGGQLVISDMTVASGKTYQVVDRLAVGDRVYTDRTYTFRTLPPSVLGTTLVRTSNSDKYQTENTFLSFRVNQDVVVYVAYDSRATYLPTWLRDWADIGQTLETTDTSRRLYSKGFTPGVITLGANSATGAAGAGSNYSVAIFSQDNGSPVNNPPVANPDPASEVAEGSLIVVNVLANDTDPEGDALTVTQVTNGANGTVASNGTSVTYTHHGSETTIDSFDYTVGDGNGGSDTATVTVSITPVNDAPEADNQSVGVTEGESGDITLTGSDVDGGGLSFTVLTSPAHGSLSGTAPNLNYSPESNFTGTDSLTFKVNDGFLDSNVATVTVSVGAKLVVSNMTVASGKTYQVVDRLAVGDRVYTDRTYTFRTLPPSFLGATLVRTANGDKYQAKDPFLRFTVNQDVLVYLAYDSRATSLPTWLRDWADTGQTLESTDTPRHLYSKSFTPGVITLGANSATGAAGAQSNYSLAIVSRGSG